MSEEIDRIMRQMNPTTNDTRRILEAAEKHVRGRWTVGAKIYEVEGFAYGEMLQAFMMGAEWAFSQSYPVTVVQVKE